MNVQYLKTVFSTFREMLYDLHQQKNQNCRSKGKHPDKEFNRVRNKLSKQSCSCSFDLPRVIIADSQLVFVISIWEFCERLKFMCTYEIHLQSQRRSTFCKQLRYSLFFMFSLIVTCALLRKVVPILLVLYLWT